MHIAATGPIAVNREDISDEIIANEKEIYLAAKLSKQRLNSTSKQNMVKEL